MFSSDSGFNFLLILKNEINYVKKNIHLIYTYNLKQKFVSRQIHLHGKKYNKTRKEVRPLTLVTINQSKKERKNSKFITQINLYITFVTKRYVNIRFNN